MKLSVCIYDGMYDDDGSTRRKASESPRVSAGNDSFSRGLKEDPGRVGSSSHSSSAASLGFLSLNIVFMFVTSYLSSFIAMVYASVYTGIRGYMDVHENTKTRTYGTGYMRPQMIRITRICGLTGTRGQGMKGCALNATACVLTVHCAQRLVSVLHGCTGLDGA